MTRHHHEPARDARARCPLCGARAARRACPARGENICAVCCATKRQIEINCPPSCHYLQSARSHPAAAVRRRGEREQLFFVSGLAGTTERQRTIFAMLQTIIARHARGAMPALRDKDVADAAAALAGTFETAARGIIYEQQADSLPAQRLATDLRQQIDQVLRPAERPIDRDLAVALRRTEALAAHGAAELEDGDTSYLKFLERRMGKTDEGRDAAGPDRPGLIIPG